MLHRVSGRVGHPHGPVVPLPFDGTVVYSRRDSTVVDGVVVGPDRVPAKVTAGVVEPVELAAGVWTVYVQPNADARLSPWSLTIAVDGPVDLATVAPVATVDGVTYTKGDPGEPGASVVGARDLGDGTIVFTLSDGTETAPVALPPGPAGENGKSGTSWVVGAGAPTDGGTVGDLYLDTLTGTVYEFST